MSRSVVITGTSSGLGQAMATRLGQAGYHIIGVARRSVAPEALGLSEDVYRHFGYDLGEVDGISDLARELVSHCSATGHPLYALINNAAIGTDGILPTMHNTDIEQLLRINVMSPIVLTKYLCRPMLSRRQGRIVNVSSVVAHTGYRGLSAYAATKSALEGFTRSLARDLGPRGITVNNIAPGFVDTPMTEALADADLSRIKRRAALSRFPEPDEIAAAAQFLVSPEAAGVTGTTITVDAGSTA